MPEVGWRIGSLEIPLPIVGAPMAGGPTTPALVAGVSAAGGLGMLAAGYLTADALDGLMADVENRTTRPYGVNIFLSGPDPAAGRADELDRYRAELADDARRLGATLGEPRWTDEEVDAKIDVLTRRSPSLVSFTFGDPGADRIARIHRERDIPVAVTVTSVEEAGGAAAAGADALVAQGIEAGGHRGLWFDDPDRQSGGNATPTAELTAEITSMTDLPVIAAGGIADGAGIAAVIRSGAVAAQLGTALLCCDEAGTSEPYRRALLSQTYADTIVTRAFSGRSARTLRNGFADRHPDAPALYPHVHHLTKPLRAAATAAGDADDINLWAGTNWRSVTAQPVAALMARLAADCRDALA
ncbi:nitronate monooxygenase [Gordonia sp. NPDC003424]